MTSLIMTNNVIATNHPRIGFENLKDANDYINKYLYDYPTGITLAFGDIELYRKVPFPYTKYGVTSSGIVFKWRSIYLDDVYKVIPTTYIRDTQYGPVTYVGIDTDYCTREIIERAKLVLLTFYQRQRPTDMVFRIDGITENDHMCNLEWAI